MKMTNALEYKIHEIIARIKELRSIEGMTEAEMAARLVWTRRITAPMNGARRS